MALLSAKVSVFLRGWVRYGIILLWVAFFSLRFYFYKTRPHVVDASAGRTYPLKNYGSVAYLTGNEHNLLQALGWSGVFLGIVVLCLLYLRRNRNT
jgi:hypothetical protein